MNAYFQALVERAPWAAELIGLAGLLLGAFLADVIARRVVLSLVRTAAARSRGRWDDALVEHRVFDRLAHLAPAAVIYSGAPLLNALPDSGAAIVQRIALAAMTIIAVRTFEAFLDAVNAIYMQTPDARRRPIRGYLQVIALVAWLFAAILVVAILLDRSPLAFLTGLSALSAVLLIVFKDTLLSLVASVQLTSNDMIRVGDWIEVPQQNADGEVTEILLHTVKVRNWDLTTTTIPTYALVSSGFRNWRTMSESGSRRIRRSLMLDMTTVRHLADEEVEAFSRWELLQDYMTRKRDELEAFNRSRAAAGHLVAEQRRLTNIGTFRAYVQAYLAFRDDIRHDLTMLVRLLEPGPDGVPLQIYCFTATSAWLDYERIQSDIFDHLLAIADAFDLRVYQRPSGADLRSLTIPGKG